MQEWHHRLLHDLQFETEWIEINIWYLRAHKCPVLWRWSAARFYFSILYCIFLKFETLGTVFFKNISQGLRTFRILSSGVVKKVCNEGVGESTIWCGFWNTEAKYFCHSSVLRGVAGDAQFKRADPPPLSYWLLQALVRRSCEGMNVNLICNCAKSPGSFKNHVEWTYHYTENRHCNSGLF